MLEEASAEVGDFKISGRIINKVSNADDTAIITKTQELQNIAYRLVYTAEKRGRGINIHK